MSIISRAVLVCLLPIAGVLVVLFALGVLLWDLVSTPIVMLLRRPAVDRPLESRNASIVVLNWNGIDYLRELMPSLRVAVDRCPGDHEVIVVDNGSTDESAAWLEREHDWAKLVRLSENRFFIRGNAAGVEAATRDILVFLNNDMRVEPEFLVELLRPFGPPDLFAVSARIEMAGERPETGLARCFVKHGELRLIQVHGKPGVLEPVMWAGGGSSAFDRRKYDEIGGFEALYEPCYVEDVSLSWQAWRRGWRALYAHGSVVHHAHRGTSTRVFGRERVERINWRNQELFFVRSITDPLLVLQHAAFWLWNVPKKARLIGVPLTTGVAAAFTAVPRLPAALWQRSRSRVSYRRSTRDVLRTIRVPDRPEQARSE